MAQYGLCQFAVFMGIFVIYFGRKRLAGVFVFVWDCVCELLLFSILDLDSKVVLPNILMYGYELL